MLSNKKASALTILLFTLLLTSMLPFGVIQCSTDSNREDAWSGNSVDDEADAFFDDSYVHEILSVGSNQSNSYLVINEFMASNDITVAGPDGNSPDWIELFNTGNQTIDLSGMYLTDDITDPTCWQFLEGTTIGPGEYLIVWVDRDGGELYASFGLDKNGEELGLFDSDGETLIDSVVFDKQIQDVSYGRIPDGGSSWSYLLSATPGFPNQEPSASFSNREPLVWSLGVLIITILVMCVSIFLASKISKDEKIMVNLNKPRLRHELKYPLTFLEYQVLKKKLATVLKPDSYGGSDGCYHIRSLYFDNFRNTALFEKKAGVAHRKKYRIRIYNHSDQFIKFERKTKFDHYILKESVRLTREDADRMIAGNIGFLADSENSLLRDFYLECRYNLLKPVVMVGYLREAYVHPVGNVRITFDTELHTGLGPVAFFDYKSSTTGIHEDHDIILEIKFDDILPLHIRGLFPNTIRPRCSIGKFVACRESMYILPAYSINRF